MFDLLSIYEMKEDIANNTAAIAELQPGTTTTTTISSTTTTATTTKVTTTTTTATTTTTTKNGISSKKTNTCVTFFDHQWYNFSLLFCLPKRILCIHNM